MKTVYWARPENNVSLSPQDFNKNRERELKLVFTKTVYFAAPRSVIQTTLGKNVDLIILMPSELGVMSTSKSAFSLPFTPTQKEAIILHEQNVRIDYTGSQHIWVGSNYADTWVNIYGYAF